MKDKEETHFDPADYGSEAVQLTDRLNGTEVDGPSERYHEWVRVQHEIKRALHTANAAHRRIEKGFAALRVLQDHYRALRALVPDENEELAALLDEILEDDYTPSAKGEHEEPKPDLVDYEVLLSDAALASERPIWEVEEQFGKELDTLSEKLKRDAVKTVGVALKSASAR